MPATATDLPGKAAAGLLRLMAQAMLACAAVPAVAEPATVGDLARWFESSSAFERGDASANVHRAGRFDGYLGALADTLAARGTICVPQCMCTLRERLFPDLERRFADPALDRAQPGAAWLAERLADAAPCPRR